MSTFSYSEFPWLRPISNAELSINRGFIFQYPPYPVWTQNNPNVELKELSPQINEGPIGLYIHIPFCAYKCSYCYYAMSVGRNETFVDQYLDGLFQEMDNFLGSTAPPSPLATVFVGGGTPTYLNTTQLHRLISGIRSRFDCSNLLEFSVESDPTTLTIDKVEQLVALGVDRLSIGIQTFDTALNNAHQRKHSYEESISAIENARKGGIHNLNIDLICGLLGETEATWNLSISEIMKFRPEHVTIYFLSVRPQTKLFKDIDITNELSEQEKIKFYTDAQKQLLDAGYIQTSPNCFALGQEHEQIHQRNAWSCHPLLGFGVSAYSYSNTTVYRNTSNLQEYLSLVREGKPAVNSLHKLGSAEQMVRYVILRFKLLSVDRHEFYKIFGMDILEAFSESLSAMQELGLVSCDENTCRLTSKGILYVDDVCRSFYLNEHKRFLYYLDSQENLVASLR